MTAEMNIHMSGAVRAAIINRNTVIEGIRDVLDLMVTAAYNDDCTALVVYRESLGEDFFDLRTGYAGEVLQKFSNYRMRISVVGDFSGYKSKALRDFIYESNKGGRVLFKPTLEDALSALEAAGV